MIRTGAKKEKKWKKGKKEKRKTNFVKRNVFQDHPLLIKYEEMKISHPTQEKESLELVGKLQTFSS